MAEFDFKLLSEDEIRANEEALRAKIDEVTRDLETKAASIEEARATAAIVVGKLNWLRDEFLNLLENLSREPDKKYILWENRSEQIQQYAKTLTETLDGR